jgi:hypothetical protein
MRCTLAGKKPLTLLHRYMTDTHRLASLCSCGVLQQACFRFLYRHTLPLYLPSSTFFPSPESLPSFLFLFLALFHVHLRTTIPAALDAAGGAIER